MLAPQNPDLTVVSPTASSLLNWKPPAQEDDPAPPEGVELWDPSDAASMRKRIENSFAKAIERYVNGYSYGGVRLELQNLRYDGKEKYSAREQNEALMKDGTLARRLKGTLRLIDEETGKELDRRENFTLARVPYLTERGTAIYNGTDYSMIMQSRLLPGAYARRRSSGELEMHFNTRPGTGSAMRVMMDPTTAQYRLKIGTSNLHAYSFFRDLGVTDEELARRWGPEILDANKAGYDPRAIDRAYEKAIPKWRRDPKLSREEKAKEILEALKRAQVAESILRENLPNLYDRQKAASWRREGAALEAAHRWMEKRAAHEGFSPDLSPRAVMNSLLEGVFDYSTEDGLTKVASSDKGFGPDLTPDEIREAINAIYGRYGPRLASMKQWPEHWLNDSDPLGWLQWYERYHDGRRGPDDKRQIERWKSFKRRHGALFRANPTPRRAFALRNWAIDPLELLPESKRDAFKEEMDRYRRKEYMKWALNRQNNDPDFEDNLLRKAEDRGAEVDYDAPRAKELMRLALEGYLQPEDVK